MTSTITRLHPNLVTNWRVDTLDDYGAAIGGTGGVASLFRVTATPPAGYAAYARTAVTTDPSSGTEYVDVRNHDTDTNLVTPGVGYRFRALIRGNFTGNDVLYIQWLDASGALISTTTSATFTGSGSWTFRDVVGTAPALAVRAQLIRRRVPASGLLAIGNYADVTGLELRREPSAGDIITPILVDGYQGNRELRSVAHPIANSAHVAVALIPAGPRTGALRLLFDNATDAAAAAALLALPALFTFADTDVPQLDMTFLPTAGDLAAELDDTRGAWIVTVPFMEVLP